MSKALALALVLVFLTASNVIVVLPVSANATTENTWVEKASMHQARSNLGVAVVNGKIYAIGGNGNTGIVGTNEEYDPKTGSWIYKAPMPTARYNFAIAVYQNKICCIGGSTNVTDEGQTITTVNEVYDPATDTWESKTPMPTTRFSLEANVVGSKIYLIGGYLDHSGLSLNEVYDPTNNSWTTEAPVPQAVAGYVSAVANEKIYIIDSARNQFFDTLENTWNQGASPPLSSSSSMNTPWGAVATTGINAPKRLYVFTEKTVESYNPDLDSWVLGADLPTDRVLFGVAVVNDLIYVIGGFTQTYQNFPDDWINGPEQTWYPTNEQYTPFGYGTVLPAIALVSPENKTYPSGNVSLAFTVNQPASWIGYSLDGQNNVTVTGNMTIAELSTGLHNVTVYAKDEFDNIGASETITFNIEIPEPFPTILVIISVIMVTVVAGLLVYHKKHKPK